MGLIELSYFGSIDKHACRRGRGNAFVTYMHMTDDGQTPLCAQETFKEFEKEAKLKPFAKAALAAHARERVDPIKQAKLDAQRWLRGAVLTLAEQAEHVEVHCTLGAPPLACLPLHVDTHMYLGRLVLSRSLHYRLNQS